jgi:hypothetical protein
MVRVTGGEGRHFIDENTPPVLRRPANNILSTLKSGWGGGGGTNKINREGTLVLDIACKFVEPLFLERRIVQTVRKKCE